MTEASDLASELAEETRAAPAPAAPVGALESAQKLGAELLALETSIEETEALFNRLKIRKYEIETKELVELMDNARLEDFSIDGSTFVAQPYYKASIPEEHREVAHAWLEAHDAGDLIDNTVVVAFPKDCEEEAKRLVDYVTQNFQIARSVERKQLVPWARLTSWLKDLVESKTIKPEDRVIPPLDIMGATIGRIVKIKKKRAK